MAELSLKSNWAKLSTIPRDIFIPANRDETSHINGIKFIELTKAPGWPGCNQDVFSHINTTLVKKEEEKMSEREIVVLNKT